MTLKELGYSDYFQLFEKENNLKDFTIGRVTAEHKERYIVKTIEGELTAEITGNMRFTAESREDFPAVGDWVAVSAFDDFGIIHRIFPRKSVLSRKAVGKHGEAQVIAANIDYAFLVQSAGNDFNINRLERYITICRSAKTDPIIILTKIDLINDEKLDELISNIKLRIKNILLIPISSETKAGYFELQSIIETGKTYCMLGSSGAGKSTLLNNLAGKELMKTSTISESVNKGRHTTSHRELIILNNGGILIDNPGMREVGITDSEGGLEEVFDLIYSLAESCKYDDCTHQTESGCAVIAAVESGELTKESYENYLKMEKERAYFETNAADKKKKDKLLGKVLKNYKKQNIKNRI